MHISSCLETLVVGWLFLVLDGRVDPFWTRLGSLLVLTITGCGAYVWFLYTIQTVSLLAALCTCSFVLLATFAAWVLTPYFYRVSCYYRELGALVCLLACLFLRYSHPLLVATMK